MRSNDGSVFIVSQKFDPHVDRVLEVLRERGVPFFRLNTDDFHADVVVSTSPDLADLHIRDAWGRSVVHPARVRSVWHRKPVPPAPPPSVTDPEAARVIAVETGEFLSCLASFAGPTLVNDPARNERAAKKLPQLRLAARLGLRIPRTIVTNDPVEARAFAAGLDGGIACKTLKAYAYRDGADDRFMFSRRVAAGEFAAAAETIAHCPTLLQEYVEKDHELRVTIIGEHTFCCRIDSQSDEAAATDWRRADPFELPHQIVPLDAVVERALRAMMDAHGLLYGAFDLIVTPSGETVFLELNPNGQWLWIELITGAPLAQAMADLLMGRR